MDSDNWLRTFSYWNTGNSIIADILQTTHWTNRRQVNILISLEYIYINIAFFINITYIFIVSLQVHIQKFQMLPKYLLMLHILQWQWQCILHQSIKESGTNTSKYKVQLITLFIDSLREIMYLFILYSRTETNVLYICCTYSCMTETRTPRSWETYK